MHRLLKPLWFLLALLFLVEAWLWETLAPLAVRLLAVLPWQQFRDLGTALVARLSPTATLVLFAVPTALIYPLKLVSLWLYAQERWLAGTGVLVFAEVVGVGLLAFLFDLCRDKLLLLPWFARFYHAVLAVKAWASAQVEPFRRAIRAAMHRLGLGGGRLRRRIAWLRRRAQTAL